MNEIRKKIVDLRSDTVTLPSPEMIKAVADAELGDSLREEDPTVISLEQRAAEIFGMEKGLLLISGTMANQVAVASHAKRGEVVISPAPSHVARKERISISTISGCAVFDAGGSDGILDPSEIRVLLERAKSRLGGPVGLVTIENTVNAPGGTIYPTPRMRELKELLDEFGVPLHLDGSRIFNALVETGENPKEIGKICTSLSFCLSKGLGAPLGSVLLGSADFIEEAKKWRNLIGGGMRQAGIFAAAGLYALENNVDRLKEDHFKAREFAGIISRSEKIEVLNLPIQTNMVMFKVTHIPPETLEKELSRRGILLDFRRAPIIRAVTHLDVSPDDVRKAAGEILEIAEKKM